MTEDAAVDQLCGIIADRLGIAVSGQQRGKLQRLLPKLRPDGPGTSCEAVLDWITSLPFNSHPWQKLIADVTVPETRFLRQPTWLEQISQLALKPLIERRRLQNVRRLRCWSAGCATGEEPYTLSIMIRELLPDVESWSVEISATDIVLDGLAFAQRGVYAGRQLRELDEANIQRHFTALGRDLFQLSDEIRRSVMFQPSNLAETAIREAARGHGEFDLIVCRNVLIYFRPDIQRQVARHLAASLAVKGCLAVSPAEASADWFSTLTPVNAPEAILFFNNPRERAAKPVRPVPSTSAGRTSTPGSVTPAPLAAPSRRPAERQRVAPTAEIGELRRLADRGLLLEARQRCEALLDQDHMDGEASLLLTEICLELDDLSCAHAAARHTVCLSPTSAVAYYLLGTILKKQGESAKARRAMNTALSLSETALPHTPVSIHCESTHEHIRHAAAAVLSPAMTRRRKSKHDRE